MKLIYHRKYGNDILLKVHLDETKVIAADDSRVQRAVAEEGDQIGAVLPSSPLKPGDPDPDWVSEYTWGDLPASATAAQKTALKDMIMREVKLLAQADLARLQAEQAGPTPLPTEGQTL